MKSLHPKLGPMCELHPLGDGNTAVHHSKLGARFRVDREETSLLLAMTGDKTIEELHDLMRQHRGAFAFKDLQVLLFQLWSHGLLENSEEIRSELFADHDDSEIQRQTLINKLSVLTSTKWMPSSLVGNPSGLFGSVGKLAASNQLLWLQLLLALTPIPLLLNNMAQVPKTIFRFQSSWVAGITIFYACLAFILSYRGLIRVMVASTFPQFEFKVGLRLRLGIIYLDMDDEDVQFLSSHQQTRFALSGLASIGSIAGVCAAAQLANAPLLFSYLMVSAFILGVLDLCPLIPTDGERLIESVLHGNQPSSIRRYIGQRLVRDLMVRYDEEHESPLYPVIASLWIVWGGVALEIFQRFILSDILALQTAIWTTENPSLQVVGGAFFGLVVLTILGFAISLAYLGLSLLIQLLSPDRMTKPTSREDSQNLAEDDVNTLNRALEQFLDFQKNTNVINQIRDRLQVETYKTNAWIQRAGRKDHRFFVVLEGCIDLLHCHEDGRHEFVATMNIGDTFGDEGLSGHPPCHDARARTECKVACLDGDLLVALLRDASDDQTREVLDRAHFLDQVPELSGLGASGRLKLAYASSDKMAENGQMIIMQGDPPNNMYIIRSGEFTVTRAENGSESTIASLSSGQTFGELGLLRGEPRNATVRATGPKSSFIEIPKQALETALSASFHVGLALEQVANQRKSRGA
ncbi:MAG: cyclic nucleotide-binding domain-containing protein [Myxococcota bacterium]|nr:cyclic nucleotide-binding domain-containing protein [Myxococcota bacterium]